MGEQTRGGPGNIVVFGATGYSGALVTDALLRRGVRPVLAARNAGQLRSMADRLGGLEHRVADVTDPASVRALVGAGDVLVSTVGPFERYGWAAAQAAVDAGAHYVDSTGEVGFVRELRARCHDRAWRTGAVMVPAFGNDYVPGILAAGLAVADAGAEASAVEIGYFASGSLRNGLSQGTRTTMADGLSLPVLVREGGRLVDRRAAQSVRTFEVGDRRKQAVLATGTEVLFLPEQFPQLRDITVYNGWFPALARPTQVLAAAAWLAARSSLGRRGLAALTARTTGPAGGPDTIERARTRTQVVAVARSDRGERLGQAGVEGPNVYTVTGDLMAAAAHRLAGGHGQTAGVVGPVEAFGAPAFAELCAEVGLMRA